MNRELFSLLPVIKALAEATTITAAARLLHITQGALSQKIKRIETLLGRSVLERSKRSFTFTAEGERLYEFALKYDLLFEEFQAVFSKQSIQGKIFCGAPEDVISFHFPKILAYFHKQFPEIDLQIECQLTAFLKDGLEKERYDVILTKEQEPHTSPTETTLMEEKLVWAAKKGFHLKKTKEIPLICFPEPCVYRKKAEQVLREHGFSFRHQFVSPSLSASVAALHAGLGVMVLPKEFVDDQMGLPKLPSIPSSYLVLKHTSHYSSALQTFKKCVCSFLPYREN
jgi:DNA-binding transcriptional LysR family regulator